MNKVILSLITTAALVLASPTSLAGDSEVTWTNPDKYRDVDAGEGHRAKFKQKVFSDFEKHIALLAEKLPDGQTLKIEFIDVDLAGDVNQGMRRIRVIKDIYSPRIAFNYQLVGKDGQQILAGEENIRDMNFLNTNRLKYENDSIGYEKKILDDWFKKTIESNG